MAEENGRPTDTDPMDALIDDLICDILSEAGHSTKARARGRDPLTALIETAFTPSRATPGASGIEKLLITQLLTSALADALAPALAEALAPEIMKVLQQQVPDDSPPAAKASPAGRAQSGRSSGGSRSSGSGRASGSSRSSDKKT
ncbi:hypothetical protein [Streptosporangium canum]|uniref:hypothetical protein n=1 Tax=Streptosporangium canum TaxID=324952 RepID=UPI0037AE179F